MHTVADIELIEKRSNIVIAVDAPPFDVPVPISFFGLYDSRQVCIFRVKNFVGMPSRHRAIGISTPSWWRRLRRPGCLRKGLKSNSLRTSSCLCTESFSDWTSCSCLSVVEWRGCLGRGFNWPIVDLMVGGHRFGLRDRFV